MQDEPQTDIFDYVIVPNKRKKCCFVKVENDLSESHISLSCDLSSFNTPSIFIPKCLYEEVVRFISKMKQVKIQMGISTMFTKDDGEYKEWNVSNRAAVMSPTFFTDGINQLNEKLEIYTHLSSNWRVDHIREISFFLTKYRDIINVSGSSYIASPVELEKSKATTNVKNEDNLCFLYSILSILKYDSIENHRERVSKYDAFLSELRYNPEHMPMKLVNITNFETINPGLAINVFQYNNDNLENVLNEDQNIFKNPNVDLIRRSNKEGRQIYLILLEEGENFHYIGVNNLDRLLNINIPCHRIRSHWCHICLHGFRYTDAFEKHAELCKKNVDPTTLFEMPKNKFVRFQDWSKTIKQKFVIYADFESILPKDEVYFQRHEPVAAGCCLIQEDVLVDYQQYYGADCVFEFLKWVERITTDKVYPWYEEHSKASMLPLSSEDWWNYKRAKVCYLCKDECEELVRDHDHFTGQYIGAACNTCNLSRRIKPSVSVVFHNLRGYDMHHILKYAISKFKKWTISCIPQTMEKYISLIVHFKKMTVRFIDSLMFLPASLANLTANLTEKPITSTVFDTDLMDGKGIFPFNHGTSLIALTSIEELPPIWENVSEAQYQKALLVWRHYECKNLLDYMLIYMKLDVYLLADVFETFRTKSLDEDGLEPLAFFSIPGMSYASAMKRLEKPVELIQDPEMYKFFEGGIRGGITFVNKHHVVADNNTELLYVDVNNLYGWALSQKLPCGNFKWIYEESLLNVYLDKCKSNITFNDEDVAFTLEVDLFIPDEIQDMLDDLPVAPLSECPPGTKVKKLLLTHEPKQNYVVHCRLLQIWLTLGVQVTKVHRVVTYDQRTIFKDYIDMNTEKRAQSTNAFHKDFYKYKNNSLYGKMVENLKKRLNIRFAINSKRLMTYTSKPQFRRSMKIDDDLIALLLAKDRIVLDRPSYIGQTVLDLSKVRMYNLQYTDLEQYRVQFKCEINIVAGDTDSFFLECKGIRLENLIPRMMLDGLLDTSNYDKDDPFYSQQFNSKIGLIKDESKGVRYKEWIFLKPKCYSLLSDKTSLKAKGVRLRGTEIKHQTYLDVFKNDSIITVPQERIGSIAHQLYTF